MDDIFYDAKLNLQARKNQPGCEQGRYLIAIDVRLQDYLNSAPGSSGVIRPICRALAIAAERFGTRRFW
jgi:hypothetical protein